MKYLRPVFFIVGIAILFLVVRRSGLHSFVQAVASLDWRFTFLALASYLAINIARVERLTLILHHKTTRQHLYAVIFLQNFLNLFLSFSGDAAYVSLLNRRKTLAPGENVASLLSTKILDLGTLAVIFLASIFFVASPRMEPFRLPALGVLAAVLTTIGILMVYPKIAEAYVASTGRALGVDKRPLFIALHQNIARVGEGFFLRQKDVLAQIIVATLANWVFTFLCGFFLLRGVGIMIDTWQMVFAYSLPMIVSLTPVFVLGGFGSFEATLVFGLLIVGVGAGQAIPASLLIHIEEFAFITLCAAAGFILYDFQGTL